MKTVNVNKLAHAINKKMDAFIFIINYTFIVLFILYYVFILLLAPQSLLPYVVCKIVQRPLCSNF